MNNTIKTALYDLFTRHEQIWETEKGTLPQQAFDAEWISPCQVERLSEENICWSPVERESAVNLNNIEEALEVKLHPSIEQLFVLILPMEFLLIRWSPDRFDSSVE
ncbi:SecY-interacting protein Syd [Psychromonas sp. KJ10-10]|uniref:SecY-interacting protein Syd n=1 Tax=Psychromonas sp. KJ10-10 TaxID=3391823 RepID=UPI0039B5FBA7